MTIAYELVNLTAQPVRIRTDEGAIIEIPPCDPNRVAFVEEATIEMGTLPILHDGQVQHVRLLRYVNGSVRRLPSPQEGRIYIVSQRVREALPDRTDLVTPDLSERAVWFSGQVVYVTSLLGADKTSQHVGVAPIQTEESMVSPLDGIISCE